LEASQQFFLQGRVVSPTPNPHPGGPGLCIYIPQRQGNIFNLTYGIISFELFANKNIYNHILFHNFKYLTRNSVRYFLEQEIE
jgi:hypothetical protein